MHGATIYDFTSIPIFMQMHCAYMTPNVTSWMPIFSNPDPHAQTQKVGLVTIGHFSWPYDAIPPDDILCMAMNNNEQTNARLSDVISQCQGRLGKINGRATSQKSADVDSTHKIIKACSHYGRATSATIQIEGGRGAYQTEFQ